MKTSNKRTYMKIAVVLTFFFILFSFFFSCENFWIRDLTNHMYCETCNKPKVKCICEDDPLPPPLPDAKAVTAFTFASPPATGVIDESAKTISVTVPYGTDVTDLTPAVTHTGASYSPTGAQDFTNPVTYTVTAADGSAQDYTVTVTVAASDSKAVTAFTFASLGATGVVDEAAKTISVNVPYGTDVTSLTPAVTHTGASYSPSGAQDFTNPVTYTVTAADGSTQSYIVTATVAASDVKAITGFTFASLQATGVINEAAKTISVNVPYGTVVTNLTPAVTHTGASYSPAGAQNFTNPVTYTVTAQDGSTQNYTVTVTAAASNAKAATAFIFVAPPAAGLIDEDEKTISITVPAGTNVTNLTPVVMHTGVSYSPAGAQDFTDPVTYTVTAADGSAQEYTVTVTVTVALSNAKAVTDFTFASISATGVINEAAKTISVNVPLGTVVTSLTPAVTHTGVSYSPTGARDFTNPVPYTVTAEDGSTQEYTVTVTVAASDAKDMTSFRFGPEHTIGVIDGSTNTISVTVTYGTDLTSLTPAVTHTGAGYSPTTAQNFTIPVPYTVTAEDGSAQNYVVRVSVAPVTYLTANYAGTAYPDTTLNDLKTTGLTVTAYYDNGVDEELNPEVYVLSGEALKFSMLNTVTASYGGQTVDFQVDGITDFVIPTAGAGLYDCAPSKLTVDSVPIPDVDPNDFTSYRTYMIDSGSVGDYTMLLDQDISIANIAVRSNVNLTIIGIDPVTITRQEGGDGLIINIPTSISNASITIGNNITLQGASAATNDFILMYGDTNSLTMLEGSKITGYKYTGTGQTWSAVFLNGGRFIMRGGEITGNHGGNSSSTAGGVTITSSAFFEMTGGSISGNTRGSASSPVPMDVRFDGNAASAISRNIKTGGYIGVSNIQEFQGTGPVIRD